MEAVEADRKNKHADIDVFNYIIQDTLHQPQLSDQELKSAYTDAFLTYIKDTVEDEMSDACIRLFDYVTSASQETVVQVHTGQRMTSNPQQKVCRSLQEQQSGTSM